MPDLTTSLQITLLGMGLVFGAIILITLFMALLVQLTSSKPSIADETEEEPPVADKPPERDQLALKQRASAAAVACALASEAQTSRPHPIRASRPRPLSPWQSAHRSSHRESSRKK